MSGQDRHHARGDGNAVGFLIGVVASGAIALLTVSAADAWHQAAARPVALAAFVATTVALAAVSVEVYGRGTMTFAGTSLLALGFVFGAGPAMVAAVFPAALRLFSSRGKLHRAVFDASGTALAAGSAAVVYHALGGARLSAAAQFGPALLSAAVYLAVNVGLLSFAMGLAEKTNPLAVWRERFRWLTPYYLASGPLALVLATAYDKVGITGLLAFAMPPAFMMVSVRLYLRRTRQSVDEVRRANAELKRANDELTSLAERVRRTHRDTIAALSRSMEAKDYYTGGHTERVSEIAVALAVRLGFSGGDLEAVEIGALLHDIGKIGIPEQILRKPAPLDDEEWKVMKDHPVISDFILSEIELHPFVRQIARSSHERLDGAGYPDGLAGEAIPLVARIVFVADAFDAITTDRPYRPARGTEEALAELRASTGTQFCPRVMRALEQVYREQPAVLGAASAARPRLVRTAA